MKQLVAVLLAGVFLATPAQAAAAPADPVSALKSRVAGGKGVTFTDVTSYGQLWGKREIMVRRGTFQYGKSGFAASDLSVKVTDEDEESVFLTDERVITVGKASYMKSSALDLPDGKSWFRMHKPMPTGFSGRSSQPVNAAEPQTLKALISAGKRSGSTYTGSITFERLWKVSPWARAGLSPERSSRLITYTLTLGSDNLPRRLVTTYQKDGRVIGRTQGEEVINSTVYKGWGGRYTITAPPADQVYPDKKKKSGK